MSRCKALLVAALPLGGLLGLTLLFDWLDEGSRSRIIRESLRTMPVGWVASRLAAPA